MKHCVWVMYSIGALGIGGCFNPDPVPSEPTTTTTDGDSSASGMVVTTDEDSTDDGCQDGCTTTGSECAEDCSLLDDQCSVGVCEMGACVARPADDGLTCDDGLFCTEGDVCTDGVCAGTELQCSGSGGCTIGVCDEDADMCTVEAVGEGDECDDTDPCTANGTCTAGDCAPGLEVCSELNGDCGVGVCNQGVGCEVMPANEGGACDVGNPCAASACRAGTCTMTMAINDGVGCDDGEFCTSGDACQAGACAGGVAAACPEDDVCGTWTCDEMMDACLLNPQNDGMPCDDGNLCTGPGATQCMAGECSPPGGPFTYLWEDFADNSAGWALGPEWEIGPAMVSMGGFPGADPGADHTATADEGVAGVVIGGNAGINLHPYYYLTSPPMAVPPGESAILGFYRWLNSDYDPFMHNSVEVFDGTGWVQVWVSGPPPEVADTQWTYVEHDLTFYASEAMRVRFGFDIAQDGVYTAPSWNVDDVLVSSIPCP